MENRRGDASESTIRLKQLENAADACHECHDKHAEHRVTQPRKGFRSGVAVLFRLFSKPRNDILKNAERTNDRTVDSPENERQHGECDNHDDIQCQNRRQEMNFRHPSEPTMRHSREIEKEQRDADEHHGG